MNALTGFQKAFIAVTSLFGLLLFLTVVISYSRISGQTGLDVMKIYELRSQSVVQESKLHDAKELKEKL
jgi:hypothetical protein